MLFIVEGFDNSGKTSLINYLIKDNSAKGPCLVFHSRPDVNHKERLREIIGWANAFSKIDYPVICDRIGIIGEEVYGKHLRGYNIFGKDLQDVWDGFFYNLHEDVSVVFIWCKPRYHLMGNKKEMEGVVEEKEALKKLYERAMRITRHKFEEVSEPGYNVRFVEFDYQEDPNYENVYRLIYGKEHVK